MRDRSLWTWHILAGLVILVLLGLHMTIMHLNTTVNVFNAHPQVGAEQWANVVVRMKSVFFSITYVLLLGAALYHGLYGLRNILFELNPAAGLRATLNVVFVLAGLSLFCFGAYVAIMAPGVATRMGG